MKRYVIKVEYVGKNYSGSQIQLVHNTDAPVTIQSELEKALSTLINGNIKEIDEADYNICDSSGNPAEISSKSQINKKRIKTVFSGRTDKGVNSKGQIVHFNTNKPLVASKFIYSMNEILPKDISLSYKFGLQEVTNDFHAQKSVKKRYYQYVFLNRPQRSAFDGDLMLIKWPLDISRMQKALSYLEGEHDFSSFKNSGSNVLNSVCFIYKAECSKLGDKIVLDIVGSRFLYNMVRTIVGTLLLIEQNNLPPETIKDILEAKNRAKAGKTVNPYGLTLMKVEY